MSQTGNLGRSAALAGAATLPVTGEHIFNFLPIVGSALILAIALFSGYNFFLRKWYNVK